MALGGQLSQVPEAGYLALYSARKEDGELAIGAALADKPWESFEDIGRPLIENTVGDPRGVIDATYVPFLNAVSWKKDGNAVVEVDGQKTKAPTPIYLQRIEIGDGTVECVGPIRTVITNDQAWEDDLVEGPSFWRRGERTYCFYSGNCYADERYAIGVPYTDDDPFDRTAPGRSSMDPSSRARPTSSRRRTSPALATAPSTRSRAATTWRWCSTPGRSRR